MAQPPANPAIGSEQQSTAANPALTPNPQTLHPLLIEYFSLSDIEEMCFQLHIEYEDIRGRGISNKTREFIQYLQRHGRLDELLPLMQTMRPHVKWV